MTAGVGRPRSMRTLTNVLVGVACLVLLAGLILLRLKTGAESSGQFTGIVERSRLVASILLEVNREP